MEKLFSTKEIAATVGVKPSYLEKLRSLRRGPTYIRLGKLVRYRMSDVSDWIEAKGQIVEPRCLI